MQKPTSTFRFSRAGLAWLAAYLLLMAVVALGVIRARAWALENLTTKDAQAEWNDWRRDANQHSQSGPVRRAQLESPEPPTLVLLRDYFGVMLAAAMFFSSLLLATVAIAVHGALAPGRKAARVVQREPWNS